MTPIVHNSGEINKVYLKSNSVIRFCSVVSVACLSMGNVPTAPAAVSPVVTHGKVVAQNELMNRRVASVFSGCCERDVTVKL